MGPLHAALVVAEGSYQIPRGHGPVPLLATREGLGGFGSHKVYASFYFNGLMGWCHHLRHQHHPQVFGQEVPFVPWGVW